MVRPTILELTFHLGPDENEKRSAQAIAKERVSSRCELDGKVDETSVENWTDFGNELENLSKDIADKIKEKCKQSLNNPRYKILVQVTIGQMKIRASRLLAGAFVGYCHG